MFHPKYVRFRLRTLGAGHFIRRALHPARLLSLISTLLPFGGCTYNNPIPTQAQQITTAAIQSGWQQIAEGIDQRIYQTDVIQPLLVVRIDPARYAFRAHYRPGEALAVDGWRDALPGAVVLVNANFFDVDNTIRGVLVADGMEYGQSYVDFGGQFQVQNGIPRVRSNIVEPYRAGEALEQLIQAFPMLVLDGAQAFTNTSPDRVTRRTVIAQDSSGRILLIVTPTLGPTLLDLAAYLPTTDMQIINALNLDGGGSTMLYLNTAVTGEYLLRSRDPVPAVLAVYPR